MPTITVTPFDAVQTEASGRPTAGMPRLAGANRRARQTIADSAGGPVRHLGGR